VRIVHVSPYFIPDHYGGVETHVYELSKELLKMGHEVAVYTCGKPPRHVDGVEVNSFNSFALLSEVQISRHILVNTLKNSFPLPSFVYELKREKADVIHLHGQEFVTSLLGFLASRLSGVPCVLTIHNSGLAFEHLWSVKLSRRVLYQSLVKAMVNSSDAVVVPTGEAFRVIERYGLKPRRTVHIPLAIDLERFKGATQSRDYVLYVGRLTPVKEPELFVKAAQLILEKVDTEFTVAGDGHQRFYLERLAEDLGVHSRISFLGAVPYGKIPEIMSHASVFVAPGNAGYSLLEAGAVGKPIVSVNLDWNVSCIGKEGAYYIEPQNERKLAEAVVSLLKDHELSKHLAAKSTNFVRSRRSWSVVINRYVKLYESLRRIKDKDNLKR